MAASIVAGSIRPLRGFWPLSRIRSERDRTPVDQDFPCPHCGALLAENARFCRECGADDETGWGDDADTFDDYSHGEEFDYDDFVQREFPDSAPRKKPNVMLIVIVALLLISMLIVAF